MFEGKSSCPENTKHLYTIYTTGGLILYLKLSYLNFQPLEVVSRYRDPQLQVGENNT